eukprot:292947_1
MMKTEKDVKPLLSGAGEDSYKTKKYFSKKIIIIIAIKFIVLLTIGLIIGFGIDWSNDEVIDQNVDASDASQQMRFDDSELDYQCCAVCHASCRKCCGLINKLYVGN